MAGRSVEPAPQSENKLRTPHSVPLDAGFHHGFSIEMDSFRLWITPKQGMFIQSVLPQACQESDL
jgi:hypothetical protein